MEIVRLPEPDEFGPEDNKVFDNTRHWFGVDFVPKMSRVLRMRPAIGDGLTQAARRAMPDRVLTRGQKELIAAAVSAMKPRRRTALEARAPRHCRSHRLGRWVAGRSEWAEEGVLEEHGLWPEACSLTLAF